MRVSSMRWSCPPISMHRTLVLASRRSRAARSRRPRRPPSRRSRPGRPDCSAAGAARSSPRRPPRSRDRSTAARSCPGPFGRTSRSAIELLICCSTKFGKTLRICTVMSSPNSSTDSSRARVGERAARRASTGCRHRACRCLRGRRSRPCREYSWRGCRRSRRPATPPPVVSRLTRNVVKKVCSRRRVIGVLDVLEIELPVVVQDLRGGAEDFRLAVQDPADPRADQIADIVGERRRLGRQRAEHQPGEMVGAQLSEAVVFEAETLGHAALAGDAAAERDALQIAFEVVAPRVIDAGQPVRRCPARFRQTRLPRWAQRLTIAWISPSSPRVTMIGVSPRKVVL